jgi:hypothetical protein
MLLSSRCWWWVLHRLYRSARDGGDCACSLGDTDDGAHNACVWPPYGSGVSGFVYSSGSRWVHWRRATVGVGLEVHVTACGVTAGVGRAGDVVTRPLPAAGLGEVRARCCVNNAVYW